MQREQVAYPVEVLETFIGEGDWDGEDGVGAVLVKASFTVPSKQSQSPASTHIQTHAHEGIKYLQVKHNNMLIACVLITDLHFYCFLLRQWGDN